MKATGIVRTMDSLGRFVIPMEMRRTLGIQTKDELDIYVEGDKIILKKYQPICLFCGTKENTVEYNGKVICRDCFEKLSQAVAKADEEAGDLA